MISCNIIQKIYNKIFCKYINESYSQEGEDMILSRYFDGQLKGFYIDIGAHHPKRFSNTYIFYKRGWSGINIDAMPGSMSEFNKFRSRDINIESAISLEPSELTFNIFKEPALNTFSNELAQYRESLNLGYEVIKKIKIYTKRLDTILNDKLLINQIIDFMSIDVEGLDLEVLQSNNWDLYKPKIILIEILTSKLSDIEKDPISIYLREKKYHIYAKCVNTVFYRNDSEIDSKL